MIALKNIVEPQSLFSNLEKIQRAAPYKVVSLFTGIGGLDLGFEGGFTYKGEFFKHNAFEVISAYEKDSRCVETIKKNLHIPIEQKTLSEADAVLMPKADILIGGFPCQDFSSCGPKKGLRSARGRLYKVLCAYMAEHKPLIVCGENVPNLARMEDGRIKDKIVEDLAAEGYKVNVWDLFAPNYGIPQNRRRLFFICVRNDVDGFPTLPTPTHIYAHRSTKWALSDLEKIRDERIPNQSQYFKASRAKNGNGQGDETCRADSPSYTVRANAKSRVQFHYKLDRRLTVRECARLQSFPDSYIFPHSATTNIMQIGNAVPPLLSYAVATSISVFLESVISKMSIIH